MRNTNETPVVQPSTFHHQVDYLLTSRERSVLKKALQVYAENRQVRNEEFWFISSPEPKAHRLIAYNIPMVHRPSVVRRPHCSNIFFSETAGQIKAKFYVEPPWVGGTKVC